PAASRAPGGRCNVWRGPLGRRPGLPLAANIVLLIDGAAGLGDMGTLFFPTAVRIVDFHHALEHAGEVLVALLGSREHPDQKPRLGQG
ncbi:MAG TPA: hypothetical protein VHH73_08200, partial [Verrucomicrobiae bacterium]|nr:hypothetical protein [Verrucomicrobiae bacterium]